MENEPRIIFLVGEVNESSAMDVVLRLLDFNAQDETKPISLYINSPGGNIIHGLAIYDTIQNISAPVYTVCYGMAASMGAFLLSCGEKGHRYALPHSRILIHQPLLGNERSFADSQRAIEKIAESLTKNRNTLEKVLSENTGKPLEVIHADCERDNWMSAIEAKEYGLIDKITKSNKGEKK
ncbi:MAG: ATP-dependent Clp protease proteolytic subunit [Bacilli bacterium]|nr:ATP-dependent Clp protease proteolytic subunit [Bacilli bacterium]